MFFSERQTDCVCNPGGSVLSILRKDSPSIHESAPIRCGRRNPLLTKPRECRALGLFGDRLPRLKRREPRHGLQIAEVLIVAYIEPAGIAHRLEIPGRIASHA